MSGAAGGAEQPPSGISDSTGFSLFCSFGRCPVAAHRPKKALVVAGWGGGGYVPGKGGLFDAMLTMAGARNVVRGSFGYYDVESLIAANPDALVYGDTYRGMASLRADQDLHPALLKRYGGRRISYASLYSCGVPESGRVVKSLQDALRKVRP